MPESSAEKDHDAVAVERLTEAVHTSRSDVADAAAVTVNVGDLRRLLRIAVRPGSATATNPEEES